MTHPQFSTTLYTIGEWTILRLPQDASAMLPSRGQAMGELTINGHTFQSPLEPDGKGSHWLRVDKKLAEAIHANAGDTVTFTLEPVKEWPEPKIPEILAKALDSDEQARATWDKATALAHWDWLRWMRATNSEGTKAHRVEVALSKLRSGERRPCCFNRNVCTEPAVSKNGALLDPA
ncbi:MAG TPA: YdeI/OmpD-associated family protein [Candidatus Saccharimonadales bacterium]|nr:YdeI/OmpD-associated family protein [Candidatus Saccharimonadales bacterium]